MSSTPFDPQAKEASLRAESESWDISTAVDAEPGDIPIIDVANYLETGDPAALAVAGTKLADACENVGFWLLTGHGINPDLTARAFAAAAQFHALDRDTKLQIEMDTPERLLGGVGYLPLGNRRLPARSSGNRNEALVFKAGAGIAFDDNPWLDDDLVPTFRSTVTEYNDAITALSVKLLPIYATALGLEPDFFDTAFAPPFTRLRMTHYPAVDPAVESNTDELGIQPHVDTTFMTLLVQDSPGLTIFHTPKQQWLNVPAIADAIVVNTGELLKTWTNDRFLSVRHFANVQLGATSRYSIPFFVNADRDFVMETIPTCHDDANPPKYAPISYNQSQAVAQGE